MIKYQNKFLIPMKTQFSVWNRKHNIHILSPNSLNSLLNVTDAKMNMQCQDFICFPCVNTYFLQIKFMILFAVVNQT